MTIFTCFQQSVTLSKLEVVYLVKDYLPSLPHINIFYILQNVKPILLDVKLFLDFFKIFSKKIWRFFAISRVFYQIPQANYPIDEQR